MGQNNLCFYFLSETKAKIREIEALARKLKFGYYDGISTIGNAGGIALLWS